MQYIYDDFYRGQPRKLLILAVPGAREYRVFCGADFLGVLQAQESAGGTISWKSEYNALKPLAISIGNFIASQNPSR